MRVRIGETRRVFSPVDIIVTIESEDELKALWHRTNIHMARIIENVGTTSVKLPVGEDGECGELWRKLNVLAEDLGLKDHMK